MDLEYVVVGFKIKNLEACIHVSYFATTQQNNLKIWTVQLTLQQHSIWLQEIKITITIDLQFNTKVY